MKKALIDTRFDKVTQVVDIGQEFETHGDLAWVDCPDEVESAWDYDRETGTFTDPHAPSKDEFGRPREPWLMQRSRAYPPVGDQLDMLHKELTKTGTISKDGAWYKLITDVKAAVPKPAGFDPNNPYGFY